MIANDHEALLCLHGLATADAGYLIQGTRGWARREDIERLTGRLIPERLGKLYRRGLVVRADVRVPGLGRPAWVYRIAAKGAGAIGIRGTSEQSVPSTARSETDGVFIPPGALRALVCLRGAEAETGPEYLPRERGWRSMSDLTSTWRDADLEGGYDPPRQARDQSWGDADAWKGESDALDWPHAAVDWTDEMTRRDHLGGWDAWCGELPWDSSDEAFWFSSDDMAWLVAAKLVQRWPLERRGRERPLILYRVTPAGRAVRALEWKENDNE